MSGAGMGHSEKLLEIAFNQRRLKAATPKLDDILGSLLLVAADGWVAVIRSDVHHFKCTFSNFKLDTCNKNNLKS